jgi:hypothetical protein
LAEPASREHRQPSQVLDDLARHVAKQYEDGDMAYEDADAIMNSVFGLITSRRFRAEQDEAFPAVTFEVYQAFDAGEFFRAGEGEAGIQPDEKYTRPLVKLFLSTGGE